MKVKLLHICYQFHPEMGYDINLFARFAHSDLDVTILTADNLSLWNLTKEQIKDRDSAFEQKYEVRIIRLPSFKIAPKKASVYLIGINRKIEQLNPDILFFHGLESPTFFLPIYRQLGKRFVAADTHTLFSQFKDFSFLGKQYFNHFFKGILVKKMIDLKVPVYYTAKENEKVLQFFGFPDEQIFNNEICTDVDLFQKQPGLEKTQLPKPFQEGTVILYTGKFDHFKQPNLILEAVKKIENQITSKVNIVFIGPRNETYVKSHFNTTFSNPLIEYHVLDAVPNTELPKYYAAANIAVFPKQNSLSCLDAQACSLPVIMEKDETNLERLKFGGLCYLEGDIEDLGRKILMLLQDNNLREKLANEGRDYMKERYNYKKKLLDIQSVLLQEYQHFSPRK